MPDEIHDAQAQILLQGVDLGDWSVLITDTEADLAEIYGDGLAEGLRLTGMGVSLDQVHQRALEWARERAASLVTMIKENTRSMIRSEVAEAFEQGWSADRLTEELVNSIGFSQDRARMIARTEINFSNNQGHVEGYREAARSGVRVLKEFLTADDDLVEDDCLENADAGPIELDDEFPNGDMPHPNCLPGNSQVVANGIAAVSDRWYDGDLIVLSTASGNKLSCTPNHPVLTSKGWVAAHLLNKGSHVICCNFRERIQSGVYVHNQNMPASIKNIAETFRRSLKVTAMPMPSTAEDFHGDGIGSEIAVIWSNSMLRNTADAAFGQHAVENDFVLSDIPACVNHIRSGSEDLLVHSMLTPSNRSVSTSNLSGAALRCHETPFHGLSFGLPASSDAIFEQDSLNGASLNSKMRSHRFFGQSTQVKSNGLNMIEGNFSGSSRNATSHESAVYGIAGHADLASDLLRRFPGEIFVDDVTSLERTRFAGHVYNLQTESGWYIAQSVVVHNCRCAIVPYLPDEEEEE